MPRKPRRTKQSRTPLLQSERYLLESGECVPSLKKHGIKDWREIGEGWVRPFALVSPAGRDELRALWRRHRGEILRDKKGRGKLWAERELEKKE